MLTTEERVTLVLGEDRVEAIRNDLISKSKYFASLFSSNFRDSLNKEYHINYDIDTATLGTFVVWASECVTTADSDRRYIKPSLERYMKSSANFDDLLRLLQLSVLFIVEALVTDLTDLIACRWLIPEKCIQIWLLAKELNLTRLRDLAQAICMERLSNVPESHLLELSGDNFISLLGNVHAQLSHPDLLHHLVLQWKLRNIPCGKTSAFDLCYPFTLSAEHISQIEYREKFEKQRFKNNIQCVVGHKLAKDNEEKACVYCWNGTTFSELVEIRSSSTAPAKNIVGRQVIGRGFDVYIVGGEYGLGTGRFEKEIWRYSTISKTWYYVTRCSSLLNGFMGIYVYTDHTHKSLIIHQSPRFHFDRSSGLGVAVNRVFQAMSVCDGSIPEIGKNEKHSMWSFFVSFIFSSLPAPRRHMAVAFLHEKLFLIGGVGRHRLKLSTVEVYDIYTGEWSKAADVPEEFTSTPPIFQVNGNLAIYKSALYIYDPKSDSWMTSIGQFCGLSPNQVTLQSERISVQYLMVNNDCVYIVDSEDSHARIWMVEILSNRKALCLGNCTTQFNNQVANGPYLIGFSFKDGTVFVEVIKLRSPKLFETLHVYSEKKSDMRDLCLHAPIGCFNIFDPNSLNERFNVLDS